MKRAAVVFSAVLAVMASLTALLVQALQAPAFDVPQAENWVFHNVTLVEPGRPPRPGSTLRIEAGAIAKVPLERGPGPDRDSRRERPSLDPIGGGDTSDLAGLYVSPGLSDLHVHYPPKIAIGNVELWSLLLLAHGVTSIRETGSVDGSIFAVREAIRTGRFPGPRIFACGAMLDGENPSFPSNRVVATPRAARAAVLELAAQGADCIKVYNKLSPEALEAIRAAAASVNLPVIGHAPHSVSLEEAGLVDLQHGTGAVVIDREQVGQADFRAADWITMDAARIATVARISLEQGIAHTPTLINARMRLLLLAGQPVRQAMAVDSGLRHLPRYWQTAWTTIWEPPFVKGDVEDAARNDFFRARQAVMTFELHEAGVKIHAGTDTLMPFVAPGSSLHGELAELVAVGISPDDVWQIATREAGRSLGLPGLGTLAPGAPADLLFLRSDPTGNLAAFAEIEAVLAAGRLYRRADLEAMLAAADAHFLGSFYSSVMGAVAAIAQGQFAPDRPTLPSDEAAPVRVGNR